MPTHAHAPQPAQSADGAPWPKIAAANAGVGRLSDRTVPSRVAAGTGFLSYKCVGKVASKGTEMSSPFAVALPPDTIAVLSRRQTALGTGVAWLES